jgi:hypothetical protein
MVSAYILKYEWHVREGNLGQKELRRHKRRDATQMMHHISDCVKGPKAHFYRKRRFTTTDTKSAGSQPASMNTTNKDVLQQHHT